MTRKEALRQWEQANALMRAGIAQEDAEQFRRISLTLHRWSERECGDGNGCIERAANGKTYWYNAMSSHRHRVPDRETGALKRLSKIMSRYPTLTAYRQGDPRGAALYILRPGDVPAGEDADSYYSRGIAVY